MTFLTNVDLNYYLYFFRIYSEMCVIAVNTAAAEQDVASLRVKKLETVFAQQSVRLPAAKVSRLAHDGGNQPMAPELSSGAPRERERKRGRERERERQGRERARERERERERVCVCVSS